MATKAIPCLPYKNFKFADGAALTTGPYVNGTYVLGLEDSTSTIRRCNAEMRGSHVDKPWGKQGELGYEQ